MTSRRRFLRSLLGRGAPAVAAPRWPAGGRRATPLLRRRCRRQPAASPGSTTTRCRRRGSCPNRSVPAAPSSTTTTTGGWTSTWSTAGHADFYKPARPLKNALYQNNRDGTFTDVTDKAGVAGGTFGMGVAVGDYDNDGFPDMFVTAYGRSILYRNNGDGTFTDVTAKAGLEPAAGMPAWTTSAVWFDYDNDGLLDLFVGSYVQYRAEPGPALRGEEQGRQPLLPLLHSAPLQADAERALSQQRRRDVPPGQRPDGHRAHAGQGARRRRDRHQQRRPHRSVRRQRHVAELPVPQPREERLAGKRRRGRHRLQRLGQPALGHGRRRGGLQRRRLAGRVHREHRPRDVLALREPRRARSSPTPRPITASRRPRGS